MLITVSNVDWPGPGKKTGVVTDMNGRRWGAFPEVLGIMQPGGVYQIEYVVRNWNGRSYNNITKAAPGQAGQPDGQQFMAPPRPQAPQASRPAPSFDDNARRMDIFVCGAVNNYLSNPNINPKDITMMEMIDLLHKFKGAWLGVFGPSPIPRPGPKPAAPTQQQQPAPAPAPNDDMNDEIPF